MKFITLVSLRHLGRTKFEKRLILKLFFSSSLLTRIWRKPQIYEIHDPCVQKKYATNILNIKSDEHMVVHVDRQANIYNHRVPAENGTKKPQSNLKLQQFILNATV